MDKSLARGIASGLHRRAPVNFHLSAKGEPRTTEARVRFHMRNARRELGNAVMHVEIRGKARKCEGNLVWFEPRGNTLVFYYGHIDRKETYKEEMLVDMHLHALHRLFQRLDTTNRRLVCQTLTPTLLTIEKIEEKRRFAVRHLGGLLIVTPERTIVTYLAPGMLFDGPIYES